jgi:uncharacterized protein (TIGR04141 family)
MPGFTCYKLHDTVNGRMPADLDEYVDLEDQSPEVYGPEDRDDFTAKLYICTGVPHPPAWGGFVHSGFSTMPSLPEIGSVGAAIVLKLKPENRHFAFTFGTTGRFLLNQNAWQRGYGLQTALNLIYPRDGRETSGKLVAVDAKRRSGNTMRSRRQASRATAFEAFDVDKLRDLVGGATGKPNDPQWGRRITGADALHFEADNEFGRLGKLCRDIEATHDREDYKEKFAWLDAIRPIYDPILLTSLENHIVDRLLTGDVTDLELAPPEIVNWPEVAGFRYHFEARQSYIRPELRLVDYLNGLRTKEDDPDAPDVEFFRRRYIRAIGADSQEVHKWPVWRCLSGVTSHTPC